MRGSLAITISSNAMQATICINSNGADEITEPFIRAALAEKGIKAGIDEDIVRSLSYRGQYGMEYVVATGKAPEKGQDGYFEYFFDTSIANNCGKSDEFVKKGKVLMKYHPAVAGAYGYTVLASMVAPVPSKNLPEYKILNIEIVDNSYIATADGQLAFDGSRLAVLSHLEITAETAIKMKTVNCDGDAHIVGDLPSGITIIAAGNIVIEGVVEDVVLNAGNDIIISNGVHGNNETTRIEAKNNVEANYLEHCRVSAGNMVKADSFLNCDVACDNVVVATGPNGVIRGGCVTAGGLIDANEIGTDTGIYTCISLQTEDETKRVYQAIIVRNKVFTRGVVFESGQITFEVAESVPGEYHCVDKQIRRYDIGKFVAPPPPKPEIKKPKILLVDDDPVALKQVYGDLANQYQVTGITKPIDALLYLKKNHPDLIILDYMMPEMSGAELFGKIRELPGLAEAPVYFLTGVSSKEVVAECLSLYPQGYLLKPISKEEILSVVGGFFKENPIH